MGTGPLPKTTLLPRTPAIPLAWRGDPGWLPEARTAPQADDPLYLKMHPLQLAVPLPRKKPSPLVPELDTHWLPAALLHALATSPQVQEHRRDAMSPSWKHLLERLLRVWIPDPPVP